MPQLDASSFPSQLFWLALSFVALYLLLSYALLPRVKGTLGARAGKIEGDLGEAEKMKSEAEAAKNAYEKALADARARSEALLSKARTELQARANARQQELGKEIEKKLSAADAAIAHARHDALSKLSPASGDLAAMIVEMLVHHKPTPKEVGAAISEISKERAA